MNNIHPYESILNINKINIKHHTNLWDKSKSIFLLISQTYCPTQLKSLSIIHLWCGRFIAFVVHSSLLLTNITVVYTKSTAIPNWILILLEGNLFFTFYLFLNGDSKQESSAKERRVNWCGGSSV